MRGKLLKTMRYGQLIDIIYLSKSGEVTKRRIKVLKLQGESFQAYCLTRHAKRTFRIENILGCIPVMNRKKDII
ncbi:transcriptional regulator [Psychrobacillus glaciei]|uniref:Transcriptional regulator n=1 Tax=Psychrobacillus glaciei TaxID=2283160 RepID=A0A5J6SNP4_9BACI|nr:transcriptional regulator [Psychrobacillus glaciei]QFF99596.1 transcriptional regulator [Psychrobacillus glaciei]